MCFIHPKGNSLQFSQTKCLDFCHGNYLQCSSAVQWIRLCHKANRRRTAKKDWKTKTCFQHSQSWRKKRDSQSDDVRFRHVCIALIINWASLIILTKTKTKLHLYSFFRFMNHNSLAIVFSPQLQADRSEIRAKEPEENFGCYTQLISKVSTKI